MANFVFPKFREALAKGLVDCSAADWRATFLMSTSSVLTETDAEFLTQFTTFGEFNGPGFSRVTLTGEAVNVDLANLRVELDADDFDFGALNAGSAAIKGLLLFVWGGSDGTSRPAVWLDQTKLPGPQFPYSPVGSQVRVKVDPEGFAHL